jgi:hypothetical protein
MHSIPLRTHIFNTTLELTPHFKVQIPSVISINFSIDATVETMRRRHVIFRSRGCRTCRARKVKCDEARPICQRCIGSGFLCQGYGEPTIFLSENPQDQDGSSAQLSNVIFQTAQARSALAIPKALQYPPGLTYVAFLVQRIGIGNPETREGFAWLRPGLEVLDHNDLFHKSSHCLAEVFYGRALGQQGVVTNGLAKYGSMLQLLRHQLQSPASVRGGNLIPVILTAIIIESVSGQSTAGLHAHIFGLSHLIQITGPKAFQRNPNHQIFEICRGVLIAIAVIGAHDTFLANSNWKTIPWKYERKSMKEKLGDIL